MKTLSVRATQNGIVITIPSEYVSHAVSAVVDYEDDDRCHCRGLRVTDDDIFARELLQLGLFAESEDGTTRVHELLDAAILAAVAQGAEGIEETDVCFDCGAQTQLGHMGQDAHGFFLCDGCRSKGEQ